MREAKFVSPGSFSGGARMTKGKVGELGTVLKTVAFDWGSMQEYMTLSKEGTIDLSWPAFCRQAIGHELARYRKENTDRKKRKGGTAI